MCAELIDGLSLRTSEIFQHFHSWWSFTHFQSTLMTFQQTLAGPLHEDLCWPRGWNHHYWGLQALPQQSGQVEMTIDLMCAGKWRCPHSWLVLLPQLEPLASKRFEVWRFFEVLIVRSENFGKIEVLTLSPSVSLPLWCEVLHFHHGGVAGALPKGCFKEIAMTTFRCHHLAFSGKIESIVAKGSLS